MHDILPIMASSVSRCIFSSAGITITKHHNWLKSEKLYSLWSASTNCDLLSCEEAKNVEQVVAANGEKAGHILVDEGFLDNDDENICTKLQRWNHPSVNRSINLWMHERGLENILQMLLSKF